MEKCSYHKGNVIFPEIEDLHDDHNNYTELVCDHILALQFNHSKTELISEDPAIEEAMVLKCRAR